MLVGEGPSRPMRTEADLLQLHAEMLEAWQYQKRKGLYSHCLPALLRPSNERSCDERHLVVSAVCSLTLSLISLLWHVATEGLMESQH